MAVTSAGIIAAKVESGRVLDVDISTYTLTVATQYSKKPQTGITWSTPYQHFANGEGLYIMPEVGSLCWICFPSDGSRAFVLGWMPAGVEGDYKSKKRDLNPGDMFMGTRDENFLILRRGGVVQIGGGPLCQRIFLPVNNTIKDFCENYGLHTLGGDLEWSVKREETSADGRRPALLKLMAREFANDPNPVAKLEIGSHEGDDKTILTLTIAESGAEGAATQIKLAADKDGNLLWEVQKDVEWKVEGEYRIHAKKRVWVKSEEAVEVEGQTILAKAKTTVDVKAGKDVNVDAPLVTVKQVLKVGDSPQPVALAPPLLTWLASHVHNIVSPVPNTPTSPPVVPPPPAIQANKTFGT